MNTNKDLIKGLRDAADFLEKADGLPVPNDCVRIAFSGGVNRAEFNAIIANFNSADEVQPPTDPKYGLLYIRRHFGPKVSVAIYTGAEMLCRKVQKPSTVDAWELVEPIFPDQVASTLQL